MLLYNTQALLQINHLIQAADQQDAPAQKAYKKGKLNTSTITENVAKQRWNFYRPHQVQVKWLSYKVCQVFLCKDGHNGIICELDKF